MELRIYKDIITIKLYIKYNKIIRLLGCEAFRLLRRILIIGYKYNFGILDNLILKNFDNPMFYSDNKTSKYNKLDLKVLCINVIIIIAFLISVDDYYLKFITKNMAGSKI